MKASTRLRAALGFALILAGCDLMSTKVSDGGGSEATNGTVAGLAVYPGGAIAGRASVILRSATYLRDTAETEGEVKPDTFTDDRGGFRLDSIPPGEYRLEIRDGSGHASVSTVKVSAGKTATSPPDTLRRVGTLRGMLAGVPGFSVQRHVQIYGMEQVVRADSSGRFTFYSLPIGRHRIHAVAARKGWSYPDTAVSLLSPGDTADLGVLPLRNSIDEDYSQWSRSRRILLNADSLAFKEILTDFPVLVRLDSSNFDFGLSDGRDIRFSGRGDRHLAFEVAAYDPARRRAEIWVKVDTLFGDARDGSIVLHSGKPGSPDSSDGGKVFSSYAGAWHLGGIPQGTGTYAYPDASPSAGNAAGTAQPLDASVIGAGASFVFGQFVSAPVSAALKPSLSFTMTAWMRASAADTAGGEIATVGDNYGLRLLPDGNLRLFIFDDSLWKEGDPVPDEKWTECATTGLNLLDDQWHHLAAVFDGTLMRIYADGVQAATLPRPGKLQYPYKYDFWIGRHGSGAREKDFAGALDEVRISPNPWGPGRIKAEFESQRPLSRFLRFE